MTGRLAKLLRRLTFSGPERNEVAVIHVDDFWLRRLVLQNVPATTIPVYPEEGKFSVAPWVIVRVLLRVLLALPFRAMLDGQKIGVTRRIYEVYLLALLDEIGARIAITFIDNSLVFQRLSRLDNKRRYFAIQNGTRTLACVRDSRTILPASVQTMSMTNFFCFGRRDVELFLKHGHRIDNMMPVGSLVGGYYKSSVSTAGTAKKYDLCLVSQWHSHFFEDCRDLGFLSDSARRYRTAIEAMVAFVQRLTFETGLSIAVCLRNANDDGERLYYESSFSGRAILVGGEARLDFSTYRAIEESTLTLALNSTVLAEVFAWGEKTLWCNIPEDEHYEMLEAGISYFCGGDYDAFKRRVVELIDMPAAAYRDMTADAARFINSFVPKMPPHQVIREMLLEALTPSRDNNAGSHLTRRPAVEGRRGLNKQDERAS